MLTDIGVVAVSMFLFASVFVGHGAGAAYMRDGFRDFFPVVWLWILVFYVLGLYDRRRIISTVNLLDSTLKATFANCIISLASFYIIKPSFMGGSILYALLIIVTAHAVVFLWRFFAVRYFLPKVEVSSLAFWGGGHTIKELRKTVRRMPRLGFKVSNFTPTAAPASAVVVPEYLQGIDMLVIDTDNLQQNTKLAADIIEEAHFKQIKVYTHIEFYEMVNYRVLPSRYSSYVWIIDNLQESYTGVYNGIAPALNVCMGLFFLLISFPFMVITAILLKLEGQGPVFVTQSRAGLMGKEFTAYQFRTLKKDIPPLFFGDSRSDFSFVGYWVKRFGISELPQLINIIKGDMYIVGPALVPLDEVKNLEAKDAGYRFRYFVKPGLTGLAQITLPQAASGNDLLEQLSYDLFYVKNRAFALDLYILLKGLYQTITNKYSSVKAEKEKDTDD